MKLPGPTRQRWSKSSRQDLEQVCIRKTNESTPIEDASLRSLMKSVRCLVTGQTATGVEGA